MKKIATIITFSTLLLLYGYNRSLAYSITNYSNFDSCKSGTSFYVGINMANSNLSLLTYFGDGSNAAGSIFGTNAYNYHTYPLPGVYTIKHILKLSGVPVDSVTYTDTVMCENGFFTAYLDVNSNCTMDAGEPPINYPVDFEIDSAGVKIDTLHVSGGGYKTLIAGKTYTAKLMNLPAGISMACPTTGIISQTAAFSGATIYTFGLQCGTSSSFDLAEFVTVRSGRHTESVDILVTNTKCTPQSAVLTAHLSPKYTNLIGTYPAATSVTGNTIVWTLPNVSAFSSYYLHAHFETGTSTSSWLTPGDTIQTSYYLTPTIGDLNTANNTVIRVDTVKSSYDPNDKHVTPEGLITPGTQLQYSIEFENDGNDTAQNIYILDTLSNYIDANSFRVVGSSARVMHASLIQSGGYNIIRFDFPGIKLLDSSHHDACRGMVIFTVRTKIGMAHGTKIPNRAGIYFDDNEVVMTPTVQNVIASLIIDDFPQAAHLSVYPNPVHDVLTVETRKQYDHLKLVNVLGQTMMEQKAEGLLQAKMDVSSLSNGIYYLLLTGPAGSKTEKIEKQ